MGIWNFNGVSPDVLTPKTSKLSLAKSWTIKNFPSAVNARPCALVPA